MAKISEHIEYIYKILYTAQLAYLYELISV